MKIEVGKNVPSKLGQRQFLWFLGCKGNVAVAANIKYGIEQEVWCMFGSKINTVVEWIGGKLHVSSLSLWCSSRRRYKLKENYDW